MTPRRDLVGTLASKDVDAIYRAVFLTVRNDEPDKDANRRFEHVTVLASNYAGDGASRAPQR